MNVKPLSILVAALFSASAAFAGGDKQSQSQPEQPQAQSQSGQSQAQSQPSQNQELVKQAQEKLSAAGHDAGPSDGVMGPKTQAALKEFQEKQGLQASGQLDQETLAALQIGTPEGTTSSAGSSSAGSSSAPSSESPSSSSGSSSSPTKQQ